MHRTFIAFVISVALAVTGMTAQPAQAGNDDVAKWIAGLAVLGIIGAAIADDNKKKKRAKQYYHQQQTHKYKKKHRRHNRKALPASCRVVDYMQGKEVRGFRRGCLKRNNINVRNLPQHCALKIRDRRTGQRRVLYTSRCLRQQGYSVARAY